MASLLHRALRMLAMMIFISGAASAQPPPPNGTQSGVTPQDRSFMQHAAAGGMAEVDVAAFDKAARSDGDAEVRAFAARTLPTLQQHLQQAQSTYAQLRGHDPANRAAASSPRR